MILSKFPNRLFITKRIFLVLGLTGILLFNLTAKFQAQTPYHRHIGLREGLPTPILYDLYLNKKGYLFLGTEIGLVRFNGLEFKRYPFQSNKGNSVDAIQEDDNGHIWCMNFSNELFTLINDTLVPHKQINDKIARTSPLRSFKIIGNDIWVVTDNLIFLFSKNKIIDIKHSDRKSEFNYFTGIEYDIITEKVLVADPDVFYEFNLSGSFSKKRSKQYGFIEFIPDKNSIITVNKSNVQTLKIEGKNHKIELPKTYLNKIKVIDNIIWLCTNNGLLAVSKTTFKQLHTFFNNIRITDIVEDHEGGLWISSVEKGLYYIPNLSIDVFEYSEYSINAIAPGPKETLFLGTGNGEVIHINKNAQVISRFSTNFNTEIEYLLYDFELNRLVSSHGYFDFSNPSNVAYEPLRLGKFATKDIHGNYIINTYNKAILVNSDLSSLPSNYSKDNPIIGIYNTEGFPFVSLFDNRTRTSIFVPSDSSYLIGTSQNLISLNRFGEERIITFNTKPILATNMLLLGQTVYIGTLQDGVLALHQDEIRQVASSKTGLSSNICKKIIHSNGQLLVVTDNDINTIDVKTEKVGILTNAIYFRKLNISDFLVTDSTYWLATNEGLVRFELTPENSSTLPIITSLNALSVKSQSFIENTTSSYTENDVQIQVDAIFYKSLGSFNYEYRLLGYDSVWRNQNAINQTFNYLSLASGNYTFQIRTKVGDKLTEIHELHFTIPKPFWRKLWFILIAIFSIPLIAYLIAQYFLNKNKQKQLVKEKLLKSQLIALRAQMNPHFMFNVLNSVQGLIYTNKKNEASIFLGKFSNLMRRTLESSEKSNITISKEIELIQLYLELEAARFEDEFTYEIIIDLNHDHLETEIPTMVIQPFIENAIKHGLLHRIGAKELYIKFSMDGDYLSVLILDNGVGRRTSGEINAKRKNHQSFATNAINTRVKLINEHHKDAVKIAIIDLEDEYGSGKGTQVTIKIKLI